MSLPPEKQPKNQHNSHCLSFAAFSLSFGKYETERQYFIQQSYVCFMWLLNVLHQLFQLRIQCSIPISLEHPQQYLCGLEICIFYFILGVECLLSRVWREAGSLRSLKDDGIFVGSFMYLTFKRWQSEMFLIL